ncbi:MAG: cob(I)yrinic acid a,c-diamide adenosyltransferase [Candidatus Dormibacteraeota bacterium]|nr:cob(I)yrinic acid a,c-diamide adenosyltransferase [Candidatus Dormibacteraeota bacterium]
MATKKTRTPVTTRRGDGGYTSLWGGEEVAKYDGRPSAYGTIDEATAVLGQARAATRHDEVRREIVRLQNDLFRLMSELAAGSAHSGEIAVSAGQVLDIEERIGRVRDACDLPEMFVIAATQNSATLDLARTVIRRAEREVAKLLHEHVIANPETLKYLNRASDLAFVLSRWEEKLDGVPYQTISKQDLE